jgi:hypothetical protein
MVPVLNLSETLLPQLPHVVRALQCCFQHWLGNNLHYSASLFFSLLRLAWKLGSNELRVRGAIERRVLRPWIHSHLLELLVEALCLNWGLRPSSEHLGTLVNEWVLLHEIRGLLLVLVLMSVAHLISFQRLPHTSDAISKPWGVIRNWLSLALGHSVVKLLLVIVLIIEGIWWFGWGLSLVELLRVHVGEVKWFVLAIHHKQSLAVHMGSL